MRANSRPRSTVEPNWYSSLDCAWRSASVRRLFEAESGLAPLRSADDATVTQALSGEAKEYYDRFLVWATKHFGLQANAPASIRRKLESDSGGVRLV